MHADDANLDLPTCTTVIYSEQGAHAAANILTVIHMPSGSQENVIRKYYNIIFSSNVSRRRCSVSSSLSTPLVQREGTPMLELAFYAYTITIRYTSSSCGYRDLVIASTFRVFFFLFFPCPSFSPLSSTPRSILSPIVSNDDEGTFRGPPTIYSAHVALSYRFHEISDTDKPSIRSSKSRGGQFSLMAAV